MENTDLNKSSVHRKWSPEEDIQLKTEFESGINIEEISKIHMRTHQSIASRLCKHKFLFTKSGRLMPYMEAIKIEYPNAYKPWDINEDIQLKEEFESGIEIKEISKIHMRTIGAIKSRLEKQGLINKRSLL